MRNILKALFSAPEAKASRAARFVAIESGGRARWTPRDYAALAREGFITNAIVHRAVKLVAESAASVTYLAYEGDAARELHPLTSLLARPHPRQAAPEFLEAVCAHLLLAGNAYVEAVTLEGQGSPKVRELYALRPDRMRVVPGPDGPTWISSRRSTPRRARSRSRSACPFGEVLVSLSQWLAPAWGIRLG